MKDERSRLDANRRDTIIAKRCPCGAWYTTRLRSRQLCLRCETLSNIKHLEIKSFI